MKLKKENFNKFGFDHEAVKKKFGDLDGNLEYVGTFSILGEEGENPVGPLAVYRAPRPDTSKGHMTYIGLTPSFVCGIKNGMGPENRFQSGKYCQDCDEVIYSLYRHDYRLCTCGNVMVDGGRDYFRTSLAGLIVRIDHLTGEATLDEPNLLRES